MEHLSESQINSACRSTIDNLKGWFSIKDTLTITNKTFKEFLAVNIENEKNNEYMKDRIEVLENRINDLESELEQKEDNDGDEELDPYDGECDFYEDK